MAASHGWACATAGLLLATAATAQGNPPPEVFFGAPDIEEAVLSPSGKRLAITSAKGAKRVGLIVLDLAEGGKITRPVQAAREDVVNVHWVNDDRLVFSLGDLSGEHHHAPGLFAVNADGSALRPLVARRSRFGTGTPDYTQLDWNHRLRLVPAARPGKPNDEVLLTEHDRRAQALVWIDTRTGTTRRVATNAPGGNIHWVLDAQGEPRATLTFKDDRVQAHWLRPGGSQWEQLFDTTLLQLPFALAGADGSGTLYVTHTPKGIDHSVLTRYDERTKAPAEPAQVITPGFDFTGHLISEGDVTLGVRVLADSETTVWLDPRMAKFQSVAAGPWRRGPSRADRSRDAHA